MLFHTAMNKLKNILLIGLFILTSSIFSQDQQQVDSLLNIIDLSESDQEIASVLGRLSDIHMDVDPHKAHDFAERAYQFALQSKDHNELFQSSIILAEVFSRQSDFEQSFHYALIAEKLADQAGDPKKIGQVKIFIANIYLALFKLEESMELFYESLRIFEEIQNEHGISTAYNGIGIVYHEQGNYDKAEEYFSKCYEINKEGGDSMALAASINNLASTYSKDQLYDKSIRLYLEALEIYTIKGNKYWECTGYNNLGESYKSKGALDIAFNYFLKAKKIAEELQDYELITACKSYLADYYFTKNQQDSSIRYALESFALAKEYQFPYYQIEAAQLLHQSYSKNQNLEEAYRYAIIHSELKDNYNIEETIRKTSQLEMQYKIDKELQTQQLEEERKRGIQILIAIIIFALLMIIFIALLARHRIALKNVMMQKAQAENELELRNKELTLNVMTLLKKNDMLSSISNELFEVKKTAQLPETKTAINKIARKIKKSSESELWKEFELRFTEVHSDFYENLLKKHSDISPGEQRLCALLRLNMSTKEIAELTGQSTQTLEKARYRIRKKLDLPDSSVNLVTYLSSI